MTEPGADGPDPRTHRRDPLTGHEVEVVGDRQGRPNRPTAGCPFCVGGIEAPEPYRTRSFPNRWPTFPDDRTEVVLYSPDHDATLATMSVDDRRRVVDLWAERTAELGRRPDVAYVHVFENHGAEAGATIAHPHGQIFAFDRVPALPARIEANLAAGHPVLEDDPDRHRLVVERDGWRAWAPAASVYPHQVRVAPLERVPDLPSLSDDDRTALAGVLGDVLGRFDRAFARPMPYMLWWHQRPTDGGQWPDAALFLEVAGLWRSEGVLRYVAGAEAGTGSFVNPVRPEDAAATLRAAVRQDPP